ncbi:MAG: hypothetical protein V3R32_05520 [Nitrosomonadaceae bacterium]
MKRIITFFVEVFNELFRKLFAPSTRHDTPDINDGTYSQVDQQREILALDGFRLEVKRIVTMQNVSQRLAICKLMAMDGVNYKDRNEVEKFFWRKGVSLDNIQILTDDFYHLQHQKFRGRPEG